MLSRKGSLCRECLSQLRKFLTQITHSALWYQRITPWSSDPNEQEIGRLQAKNWHVAVESGIKALYAALPPEDTEAYIEACQDNLRAKDLKISHTWFDFPYPFISGV